MWWLNNKRNDLLSEKYRELKSLDDERMEFISIIAHQLRSPLATVRLAHQTLLENSEGNLSDDQIRLLRQVEMRTARIYDLTSQLLDADRITRSDQAIELTEASIEDILDALVTELSLSFTDKSIELVRRYDSERRSIKVNVDFLSNALINIIDNAILYTPNEGLIIIKTEYSRDGVLVTISDSGPGIPADKADQLFKKFSRLDNVDGRHKDGLGLGLYIAAKSIEKHKGTIKYKENKPVGSTFVISIPSLI